MTIKQTVSYFLLFLLLSVWFVSLLVVYSTNKIASTFPSTIDAPLLTVFLVSTALSAVTSLLMGLDKLGTLAYIRNKLTATPRVRDTMIRDRQKETPVLIQTEIHRKRKNTNRGHSNIEMVYILTEQPKRTKRRN